MQYEPQQLAFHKLKFINVTLRKLIYFYQDRYFAMNSKIPPLSDEIKKNIKQYFTTFDKDNK